MTGTRSAVRGAYALSSLSASLIAVALAFLAPLHASATEVRVRLSRLKSSFSVSGMNLRFPGSGALEPSGFQAIRVQWRPLGDGTHQFHIEDRDTGDLLSKFRSKSLELVGTGLRMSLKPVPDRLSLIPVKRGEADLIARMDLESYLRGVLPGEMPATWPLEALKAQAVAARTFALFRMKEREKTHAPYHLESTVMDQVFLMEDVSPEHRTKVERALRETRGLVLRDRAQRPFAAYFHADCGGRTEEARAVWGGGEALGTVQDGACPLNPKARWRLVLSLSEVASRLRDSARRGPHVALLDLTALDSTPSGRVGRLKLKWSDGGESIVSGHEFRMAMGYDRVKSTQFQLKTTSGSGLPAFELSGLGYGHGVGLCQWGARHLAESGRAFREILKHYYPKATLSGGEGQDERLASVKGLESQAELAGFKEPEKL